MFRSVICLISVRRPEETGLIVERGDYVEVFDHRYLSNHVYTPFIMLIRSCSGEFFTLCPYFVSRHLHSPCPHWSGKRSFCWTRHVWVSPIGSDIYAVFGEVGRMNYR